MRKSFLSVLASFAFCGAASATPVTLDFTSDQAGQVVDGQVNPFVNVSTSGGANLATVFDSANPTGGDTDLVLLNNASPMDFGSPSPGGNILIIAENSVDSNGDGLIDVPDDNAGGGTISFDFLQEVTFFGFNAIDFTDAGGSLTVDLFGAAGELFSFTVSDIAGPGVDLVADVSDNTFIGLFSNVFGFDGITGVTQADITLSGSGAIDNLRFEVSEVPIPAALPLMMTALGFGGFVSRRRKAKIA